MPRRPRGGATAGGCGAGAAVNRWTEPAELEPARAVTGRRVCCRHCRWRSRAIEPVEPDAADASYDPEVAAIFSDEATELLEACQSSFQGISLDRTAQRGIRGAEASAAHHQGWRAHGRREGHGRPGA